MATKRPKIQFETIDQLLGAPEITEGTQEIKIDQIYPFENHPFKVLDDARMDDLVESIKANGVLSPVLLRPDDEGTYEMISGHRRMHAAKLAGLTTVPAIVKEMTNDEAIVAMVDSNVQREEILPSERAWSLKMKMDAMKRQGTRTDLQEGTSAHNERKLEAADIIGEEAGISRAQVRRYIRLTELIPELLDMVDEKRLTLTLAVDISFFPQEIQQWIYEYRKDNGFLKPTQIAMLKDFDNLENVTQYTFIQLMNEAIPRPKINGAVSLTEKKLDRFFPDIPKAKDREKIIIELLEKWSQGQEGMIR